MSLFDILCETLTLDGWEYQYDEKNEIVHLQIAGVNTNFMLVLIVDEEQESILCHVQIKRKTPAHKYLDVCEFMNLANYELANGNFEMDSADGEIRYRTFLDLASAEPTREQIVNLISNGLQSFDMYYPGLMELMYGNLTPEEAIQYCRTDELDGIP